MLVLDGDGNPLAEKRATIVEYALDYMNEEKALYEAQEEAGNVGADQESIRESEESGLQEGVQAANEEAESRNSLCIFGFAYGTIIG